MATTPAPGARSATAILGRCLAIAACTWLGCHDDAAAQTVKKQETGFATYYSRAFHGDETASGETFDANAMVAAHRTLPFDSVVRVTNLENGKRVQVRIVDRGPYGENWREGTIIDVAPAAARRLGMLEDGQVRVRVEVIKTGAKPRGTEAKRLDP